MAVQARTRIGLRTRALIGYALLTIEGCSVAVRQVGSAVDRLAVVAAVAFLA